MNNPMMILIAIISIAVSVIGGVYAFSEDSGFQLDRPAWKSELDQQGDILYELAADNTLNRLDRAERRRSQIRRQRKMDTGASSERLRQYEEDDQIWSKAIKKYKRDLKKYESQGK